MSIGQRVSFIGVDYVVLADGHGVAFDILSYAFGLTRFKIESERVDLGEEEA